MKKKIWLLFLTGLILSVTLGVGKSVSGRQEIFINEVRSHDASVKRDGCYGSDYIELYNASSEAKDLSGWYISDDETDLKKCRIDGVVIQAGEWVLLYADGKNDSGDSLNFKLNAEGEKIFLSDARGNLVDSVYVPKLEFGTVYARVTDGAREWAVLEETAAASNAGAKKLPARSLKEPLFSHESGFYDNAFTLTLEAGAGETIYYTLDGSVPDENSFVYEDGIEIRNISAQPNVCSLVQNVVQDWKEYTPDEEPTDKAVIVRAVAMNGEEHASEVVTKTYFVDEGEYQDRTVLSITADFEDFFGKNGIFVTGEGYDEWYLCEDGSVEWTAPNFLLGGRAWEIQGNLQIFEKGTESLNQKIGIRTQGASTRMYAKKRMSIYARKEYSGSSYFQEMIFPGKRTHSFSLNESVSNVALPELVSNRQVAVQEAKKVTVFLNGEFWYDTYVMEKYDKYYLEQTYGVDRDNVVILKNQEVEEGPENGRELYQQMLEFAQENDLSLEENYARLEEMVDMQSYIDYLCANIYLCNMDLAENKNYLVWRTVEDDGSEQGDGRWRFMMYDTDCLEWMNPAVYGVDSKAEVNSFSQKMEYTETAITDHILYKAVKENEKFRIQFAESFLDMVNTDFSMEHVQTVFESWDQTPEMYGDFFEKRSEYIVPCMIEELELTELLGTALQTEKE